MCLEPGAVFSTISVQKKKILRLLVTPIKSIGKKSNYIYADQWLSISCVTNKGIHEARIGKVLVSARPFNSVQARGEVPSSTPSV